MKRAIQKELETPLARKLVGGEVKDGQDVQVDATAEGLTFHVTESLQQAAAS